MSAIKIGVLMEDEEEDLYRTDERVEICLERTREYFSVQSDLVEILEMIDYKIIRGRSFLRGFEKSIRAVVGAEASQLPEEARREYFRWISAEMNRYFSNSVQGVNRIIDRLSDEFKARANRTNGSVISRAYKALKLLLLLLEGL